MTTDQPTSDQLASFDQTHAALAGNLNALVVMYRAELADGQHPDVTLAGLAEWLLRHHDAAVLAEHLAVAVRRLHDTQADVDAAYERGKAETIAALEAPGSLLCDCDAEGTRGSSRPTNPTTGQLMDHHCDCAAVNAAATLLGDRKKTRHAAQCIDLDPRFGGSDA